MERNASGHLQTNLDSMQSPQYSSSSSTTFLFGSPGAGLWRTFHVATIHWRSCVQRNNHLFRFCAGCEHALCIADRKTSRRSSRRCSCRWSPNSPMTSTSVHALNAKGTVYLKCINLCTLDRTPEDESVSMSSGEMSTSLFSEKVAFPVSPPDRIVEGQIHREYEELKIPTYKKWFGELKDSESTSLSKSQLMSPVLDSSSVQLPKPSSGPMEVELPLE